VICLALSVLLSVVQFSGVNVSNTLEDRTSISLNAENEWASQGQGSATFAQEQVALMIQCDTPVYVKNILLEADLEKNASTVTVYYRSSSELGAEWKESVIPLEAKNGDIYFELDDTVAELAVALWQPDEAGIVEVEGITLNPTKLNVNYLLLLLTFLLPFTLILLIVEIFCDKEGFAKMATSLAKYRCLLIDLVSRDIKTKYRRSVLGIFWSVLNPLLMMLVLTAIFSNIFRFDIQDFPVYYLTGYIMFNFVSEATNFSMYSIIGAAGLIKKVYIPKILFPLEKCLFSLVNFAFSLIAAVIVFLIVGVTPSWTMLLFFVPVVYLFVFNFGFGLILATMNTFFRDVGYLYNVFVTLWMYLTPIIYPITALPGWMQSIVRVNPLYHYVEYFRAVTLYGTLPSLQDNLICIAYSLIFLFIGVMVFQKKQNKFIFYV
jgi:ABC-2 type transport system permease protein